MPLYEYQCEKCGDLFEVMQKFSDEPLKVHEKCGGPVHRLISAPALQFKGSGWYITDYAKSGGTASDASKSSSDKPASNGTSSKESTPAKTETSSTPAATTSSSDKK
jgi:putative FmdB family regulatory protein